MSKQPPVVSRRKFLRTALGSSLIAALAPPVFGGERIASSVDVVIIGAGLAGLTAALELRTAGRSVCVVEARQRVGGRTLDYSIGGGHVVERGGQWIGSTQTEILALAEELGVENFPSYTQGKTVLYMNGTRFLVDDIQDNPTANVAKSRPSSSDRRSCRIASGKATDHTQCLTPISPFHANPTNARPLRIVRLMEVGQPPANVGRMVISGRMADVCAELDRLVAREAALH